MGLIATDRPAFTNSSVVVPTGSLQVENGFLQTSSQGQSVIDAPESLVRFGLVKTTELRFTVPDYFHNLTTGNGVGSGFGGVAIGVKRQLGPTHGFDVSANRVPQSTDRRQRRVERRVRSGIAGALVAHAVRQLDGGRNVFGVLAYSGPHTKRDRRDHVPFRIGN